MGLAVILAAGCGDSGPEASTMPVLPNEAPGVAVEPAEFLVGGLYSMKRDDGSFVVVKVLAVDDTSVHLRRYANKFSFPPLDVELDPAELTLGGVGHPYGWGIGHYPVGREHFRSDSPALIMQVPVHEDELVGYRHWQSGESRSRSRPRTTR
jgi:hypothetical protein